MQCEVWSVECEDFASSLAEKTVVEGRTRSGQVVFELNHLCLGNFRRRLARVYVRIDFMCLVHRLKIFDSTAWPRATYS